jgi:hypothetical protein
MPKPKLFLGSSKANIRIARTVANRLESDECGEATIWDEGLFSLNEAALNRLMAAIVEFDFAILIWAADDITKSKGKSAASPRDNVIFECGLFMGAMGKDRVFVVCDKRVKIPSDFAGVTLATYDGLRASGDDAAAAMREACDAIAEVIRKPRFPYLVGEWRSRYALTAVPGHGEMIDDVEISPSRDGILILSKKQRGADPYSARARIYNNQIMGEWQVDVDNSFDEGLFVLTINTKGTVMYGYCTCRDENGTISYTTWVLAKKTGRNETQIKEFLHWGENALKERLISLPLPEV